MVTMLLGEIDEGNTLTVKQPEVHEKTKPEVSIGL